MENPIFWENILTGIRGLWDSMDACPYIAPSFASSENESAVLLAIEIRELIVWLERERAEVEE